LIGSRSGTGSNNFIDQIPGFAPQLKNQDSIMRIDKKNTKNSLFGDNDLNDPAGPNY
jgi:hypothetical protein